MLYRSIKILFISLHILATPWSTMTSYRLNLWLTFFIFSILLPLILHVSPTKRSHHQSSLGLAFLMNLRQLICCCYQPKRKHHSSRAISCKSSTNRGSSFVLRNGLVIPSLGLLFAQLGGLRCDGD